MYVTNFSHFIDNSTGDIPVQMPEEVIERASFFAIIIEITTQNSPLTLTSTEIRCFEKGCSGMIKTALRRASEEIHWYCPDCEAEGVISNWQGTKWDNT
jgi:hypothetical protein